jgi:hypothetical protein
VLINWEEEIKKIYSIQILKSTSNFQFAVWKGDLGSTKRKEKR